MTDFTGTVRILSASGQPTHVLENGNVTCFDAASRSVFAVTASGATLSVGANGSEGNLRVLDGAGRVVCDMDGNSALLTIGANGNEGDVRVLDGFGRAVFAMDGENALLTIGASGNEGDVRVLDSAGRVVCDMDGNSALLTIGADGNEGDVRVLDGSGRAVFAMDGASGLLTVGASGNDGEIRVLDNAGTARVRIIGSAGDIVLSGADCAEEFELASGAEPGDVLVIDEGERLRRCLQAYDRRVAGVMSGAGDLRPGIVLDRRGGERRAPIALAGKVVCKVDAGFGAIEVGDLLTTSPTPGHAMRAADPSRAFGAVLGKALRGLPGGRGLVPVLVGLQ